MDVNQALQLLGGLSPAQFMRRHWQKKPLLVRQAIPAMKPGLSRAGLLKLAGREEVESRLIMQTKTGWTMEKGPFSARRLPPLSQSGWTLLVQGADQQHHEAHRLLQMFRFVPDARLDDLMISFATPGGGVGPHFDSYDVFLLQASGSRRWKIGRQKDLTLQPDVPLKILKNFEPEQEFVLEAGDMLYLPPRYAHDGVAEAASPGAHGSDCMTYSIGFRAPERVELAAELLHRLAEFSEDASTPPDVDDMAQPLKTGRLKPAQHLRYRDPSQLATSTPAAIPAALAEFAADAVRLALKDPLAIGCALGETMTSLKPGVWFDGPPASAFQRDGAIHLDARTKMMYDAHHVFVNGESYRAQGADARLMHRLADQRGLAAAQLGKASEAAIELLADWHEAGWLHGAPAIDF